MVRLRLCNPTAVVPSSKTVFSTAFIPYPHFGSVWICGSFLSKEKNSRTEHRFEKGNEKHWQARREIAGWLLSFLNKLLEFEHGLVPSAQLLLLPGFSCGKNNNRTLYCDGECCSQCHRITAFTHHKNNTSTVWILAGLQGLNIGKSYGSVRVWGAFCWSLMLRTQVSKKEAFPVSQEQLHTHPRALRTVGNVWGGHNHEGQT